MGSTGLNFRMTSTAQGRARKKMGGFNIMRMRSTAGFNGDASTDPAFLNLGKSPTANPGKRSKNILSRGR